MPRWPEPKCQDCGTKLLLLSRNARLRKYCPDCRLKHEQNWKQIAQEKFRRKQLV